MHSTCLDGTCAIGRYLAAAALHDTLRSALLLLKTSQPCSAPVCAQEGALEEIRTE